MLLFKTKVLINETNARNIIFFHNVAGIGLHYIIKSNYQPIVNETNAINSCGQINRLNDTFH